MKIPQLKKTIFGNTLRTGSLFLTWTSLVLGVILFAIHCFAFFDTLYNFEERYPSKYLYDRDMDEEDYTRMFQLKSEVIVQSLFIMLAVFILMALKVSTLFGITKRKPRFMLPSITLSGAFVVFVALKAFYSAFNDNGIDREVFQMIVFNGFAYYCFLVVFGHYREIKEANRSDFLSQQILSHESMIATDSPMKTKPPVDNYSINNVA